MTDSPTLRSVPTDDRWLSASEQAAWRAFLDASRGLLDRLEQQLSAEARMPLAYYDILVVLSEAPQRTLRMGELARRLRSSSSRLAHAVARLEGYGWVRRESVATDRRGAVAVLTSAGYDALAAATPGHVDAVRRHLIDALSPQQISQLTDISRSISAAI